MYLTRTNYFVAAETEEGLLVFGTIQDRNTVVTYENHGRAFNIADELNKTKEFPGADWKVYKLVLHEENR